jgi:hypothetical protein
VMVNTAWDYDVVDGVGITVTTSVWSDLEASTCLTFSAVGFRNAADGTEITSIFTASAILSEFTMQTSDTSLHGTTVDYEMYVTASYVDYGFSEEVILQTFSVTYTGCLEEIVADWVETSPVVSFSFEYDVVLGVLETHSISEWSYSSSTCLVFYYSFIDIGSSSAAVNIFTGSPTSFTIESSSLTYYG